MKQHYNTKKWKRHIGALAVGSSTLLAAFPAVAQDISVFVDGNVVNFGGVPPESKGGRLLVPLRGVFEALGAVVDYDVSTRTIEALRGDTRLKLTLGSTLAFVNGQQVTLETPAETSLGRTMVPLRFVGEAFGANVNWNAQTRSVVITSPSTVPLPNPPEPQPQPPNPTEEAPEEQTVLGTFVGVGERQANRITIRTNNVEQTYEVQRNAQYERRPLLNRSTLDNPVYGTILPIAAADLHPGEQVQLTLNRRNRVVRVTATPSVTVAKVLSTSGNRITLDDGRNLPLVIGQNLRYINPQGQAAETANLRPGDEIVLFVSPDTRRVYQVSAYRNDVNSALGRDVEDDYLPPITDDQGPVEGRPQIDLVTFTTNNPNGIVAKAGDVVTVNVRGTAGLRGTFDLSGRATNLPLRERGQRPGHYFGSYTVRQGDDVTNGRITVRLIAANGDELTQQSLDTISIDTEAPMVIGNRPLTGAVINNARPNIVIYAEELGSGLAPSTVSITNGGETFEVPATAEQSRSVSAIPQRDLSGRVDVRAEIRDEAGNSTTHEFSFTVRGRGGNEGNGPIESIFHNANRVLEPGERLTVDMIAESGGRASFDLLDENNRIVARDVPMTEVQRERGRYRGEYVIEGREAGQLRVVGRFRDNSGRTSTSEATTPVDVVGGTTALNTPVINTPREGDTVGREITVRGRGVAGSTVQVTVRAQGTQYYVLPYNQEITTPTVRVRNNGTWETAAITLPNPRGISGLRFVISAIQIDGAGRESEEATITVRPQ